MDIILLIILFLLLGATLAILYLSLKSKTSGDNKEREEISNLNVEIVRLEDTLNTTINNFDFNVWSNLGYFVFKH